MILPLSPPPQQGRDGKLKLAILGSTRGSNLLPIEEAIRKHELNAAIAIILSNKRDAGILAKAEVFGIEHLALIAEKGESRVAYDRRLIQVLQEKEVDLIVLIGFMRILSEEFIEAFRGRMINVHPSLLPKHKGLMDLAVHEAVLKAGEQESGCSVHLVTEEVDGGEVLVQKHCPVYEDDTPETLKVRVQALEGPALIAAIKKYC